MSGDLDNANRINSFNDRFKDIISIFEDKKIRFGEMPTDLKKLFVAHLITDPLIATKIIDICNEGNNNINKLLCDNREFWEFLWKKYISTKPFKGTFENLKKEYTEAIKLYNIDVHDAIISIKEAKINNEKKEQYDIIYKNIITYVGIQVDYEKYKNKYKQIVYVSPLGNSGDIPGGYIEDQNINAIKYLIDIGMPISQISLIIAAKNDSMDIVKLLVESGANVNVVFYGKQPLHYAIENNNFEMVKYLVDNGTIINTDIINGEKIILSPLINAAEKNNVEIMEYLLSKGADPNFGPNYFPHNTLPLFYAVSNNQIDIIKLLIKYNVDLKAKNIYGKTLLMEASSAQSNYETFEFILNIYKQNPNLMEDLNILDRDKLSALLHSIMQDYGVKNDMRKAIELIEAGADYNVDSYRFGSAIGYAQKYLPELVPYLQSVIYSKKNQPILDQKRKKSQIEYERKKRDYEWM